MKVLMVALLYFLFRIEAFLKTKRFVLHSCSCPQCHQKKDLKKVKVIDVVERKGKFIKIMLLRCNQCKIEFSSLECEEKILEMLRC